VRPFHQILQCAMPGDHRFLRAGEEIEALVETFLPSAAGLMARMRAAASSSASGSPSRCGTMSIMSATLSGPRANPGRGGDGAFDEEASGRSFRCRRRTSALVRNRKGPDPPHLLARKSEDFAAGSKNGHVRTPAEETPGERRDGGS